MKRTFALTVCYLLALLPLCATIPEGYYGTANQKTADAALAALHECIDDHKVISYDNLEDYYEDIDFDVSGHLMDMYSTCIFTMSDANGGQKAVCDCWNKEHSIPQSWFNKKSPMKSDLFHVYPTDARVNNFRGNLPYGECAGSNGTGITKNTDNHALGKVGNSTFSGYSGKVFEPDDEYKGDFARTYFYMIARYLTNALNASEGQKVFTYTNGKTGLTTYALNLFLKWHREDPVSQKEIDRNNAVYKVQKNRNPFIDFPYLVEYIWGKEQGRTVAFDNMVSSEDPNFVPGKSDGQKTTTDIVSPRNPNVVGKKIFLNGQLLIEYNGQYYNTLGQPVTAE